MKINIKTTNITLDEALRVYVGKKIGELDKFTKNIGLKGRDFSKGKSPYEAWVEIGKPSEHHKKGDVWYAEVQIRLPGKSIRAESKNWDLRLAIDEVSDELQRELRKYTEKQITKNRKGATKIKEESKLNNIEE